MARDEPQKCMKLIHLPAQTGESRHGRVDICGEPYGHEDRRHRGIRRGIVWELGNNPTTGQPSNTAPPVIISHGGSTVPTPKDGE